MSRRQSRVLLDKKPKDVEDYIAIWGWMDSVVCAIKRGPALSFWKMHSVPRDVDGTEFRVLCNGRLVKLRYSYVVANRFWFKEFFVKDMRNWRRLYGVFASAVSMR